MSECTVEGCVRSARTRGWCATHYSRWRLHGDVQAHRPVVPKGDATQHALYATYLGIKARCFNPNAENYVNYGARGIIIDPAWRYSAAGFIAWIEENLGPRPEGATLDRIDNNGNYEPGNLRWATRREQWENSRTALETQT